MLNGPILHDAAQSAALAAWITAGAAVIAALVSATISSLIARRSVYINSVTVERSRWIEALRSSISKYSGVAGKISSLRRVGEYETTSQWAEDTQSLRTLLAELTLRLNPTEETARNLLKAAKKLNAAARLHSPAAVILADEIMTRHAQWVLKGEWERVKQEASGALAAPRYWVRSWLRQRSYNRFLTSEGSLHRLDSIGAGETDAVLTLLRSEMDI